MKRRCINCHWLKDDNKSMPTCLHRDMTWEGKQIIILNKWDMSCKHFTVTPKEDSEAMESYKKYSEIS